MSGTFESEDHVGLTTEYKDTHGGILFDSLDWGVMDGYKSYEAKYGKQCAYHREHGGNKA